MIMNSIHPFRVLALLALALPFAAPAAEPKVAGPNGGRILEKTDPRAEFFVRADRRVQITFLNAAGQPIAPTTQTVRVISGERSAPRALAFAPEGLALVSDQPIPEGAAVPTVVQIRRTPDAPTVTERFNTNLTTCSECRLAEYACICDH